jgi:hypothetical protein
MQTCILCAYEQRASGFARARARHAEGGCLGVKPERMCMRARMRVFGHKNACVLIANLVQGMRASGRARTRGPCTTRASTLRSTYRYGGRGGRAPCTRSARRARPSRHCGARTAAAVHTCAHVCTSHRHVCLYVFGYKHAHVCDRVQAYEYVSVCM